MAPHHAITKYTMINNHIPCSRGIYLFHRVRLSICLSMDRIVSALYLIQNLLDPFHICTPYYATAEGVLCVMFLFKIQKLKSFGKFVKFVALTLSCFLLGIQYELVSGMCNNMPVMLIRVIRDCNVRSDFYDVNRVLFKDGRVLSRFLIMVAAVQWYLSPHQIHELQKLGECKISYLSICLTWS